MPTKPKPEFPPFKLADAIWKVWENAYEWQKAVERFAKADERQRAMERLTETDEAQSVEAQETALYDAKDRAKEQLLEAIDEAVKAIPGVDLIMRDVRGTSRGRWSSTLLKTLRGFHSDVQGEADNLVLARDGSELAEYFKKVRRELHNEQRRLRTVDESAFGEGREAGGQMRKDRTKACQGVQNDWREVRDRLLKMRAGGEAYKSQAELAKCLGCSKGLINKALKKDVGLKAWMGQARPTRKAKVQRMSEVVLATAADEPKDEPSASLTDRQVDQIMAELIEQAKPNEQARLKAMDAEAKRRLAETYQSQKADRHVEDEAAKGNAILGH